MNDGIEDELWPHFAPLWTDLRKIAPAILLAGGYGLFLKQQWLISQLRFLSTKGGDFITTGEGEKQVVDEVRTLVAIQGWIEQTPRVTKDFDFIAGLDLIASPEEQRQLDEILKKHDFGVVPANARWQFAKVIGEGRQVVLDFHTPLPAQGRDDVRVQSRRIKPRPSLGQTGIHGRENAEAAGAELHPFVFKFKEQEIMLPNPVTLTVMKLTALRDRWSASQGASITAEARTLESQQARKHAEDVFRIVAMMTREESQSASAVLRAVSGSPALTNAATAFSQFFKTNENWGTQVVAGRWRPEDFARIKETLGNWLK